MFGLLVAAVEPLPVPEELWVWFLGSESFLCKRDDFNDVFVLSTGTSIDWDADRCAAFALAVSTTARITLENISTIF